MLHSDCVKKILALEEGEAINRGFLDLFKAVVNDSIATNLPNGTLVVPFYDENTDFKPGDWAAELNFVVRKIGDKDEAADSSGDSETKEV